eukprot:scaffold30559_cov69-Phaeocystis_antarctica.AAC.4
MCHLCPSARGRSGGAFVRCSRMVGTLAACAICCAAITAARISAIRIAAIMPTVTRWMSK